MREECLWLCVIGASQSHVPFIQAAKKMGYRTIVFDRNPSTPGAAIADMFCSISTHDTKGILTKCGSLSKQAPLAGVITYSAYTMPLRAVAQVAETFGLCSFSMQAVENITNKERMKQRLCQAQVPTPEWLVTTDLSDAISFLMEYSLPIIVKPISGSMGSSGISLVVEEQQLSSALETASQVSDNNQVLLEKFHQAPEFSVGGIISKGRSTVLAISEKYSLGAAHNFIISGFATDRSSEANTKHSSDAISKSVSKAVEALGINDSFFGADVLLTEQGPLVLEVGLLLDAKIDRLLYFCGVDVYKMLCCVACGLDIEYQERIWSKGCALQFMFADCPGLLTIDSGVKLEALKSGGERWTVEWERHDGDFVQPPRSIADTIGWVIAEGRDRASAYELASNVASDYRFVVRA